MNIREAVVFAFDVPATKELSDIGVVEEGGPGCPGRGITACGRGLRRVVAGIAGMLSSEVEDSGIVA